MSELPIGLHAAFQVLWLVAIAVVVVAAKATELGRQPSAHAALSIVLVTSVWALVAGLVWGLRVVALTGCDRWGERTRRRVQERGRREHGR